MEINSCALRRVVPTAHNDNDTRRRYHARFRFALGGTKPCVHPRLSVTQCGTQWGTGCRIDALCFFPMITCATWFVVRSKGSSLAGSAHLLRKPYGRTRQWKGDLKGNSCGVTSVFAPFAFRRAINRTSFSLPSFVINIKLRISLFSATFRLHSFYLTYKYYVCMYLGLMWTQSFHHASYWLLLLRVIKYTNVDTVYVVLSCYVRSMIRRGTLCSNRKSVIFFLSFNTLGKSRASILSIFSIVTKRRR